MKNYLLISLAFLLLLACKGEKQDLASPEAELISKHVTIYLMLINEIPDGVTDPKDYIQFYVEGDSVGSIIGKPNEFTTTVFAGKKVKWKSAQESIIKIKEIIFKKVDGNINILESGNISDDPTNDVERKVKTNDKNGDIELKNGDIELYGLKIKIKNKEYEIDPRLKYHD